MTYNYNEQIVSDLHKDARGYRPSHDWWSMWKEALPAGKQLIWDNLCRELDAEMERERAEQVTAVFDYELQIANNMALGAGTRTAAIKWILQSMNLTASDLCYGGSYVCFELGLPYTMAAEFDDICKDMLATAETTPMLDGAEIAA